MKETIALQLLPYALFLTVLPAISATSHAAALRLDLTHVDSGRGFTKGELLRRMAARSRARIDSRWSPPDRGANSHAVTAPVARGTVGKEDFSSEYLIHFGIGTPRPQHVALTLDTGSDLVWTQCFCQVCFPQPFPELDTSASGTARGVSCFDPLCVQGGFSLSGCAVGDNSCFYTDSYGDNSVTTGMLYEDTFTFQQPAPNGKAAAVVPNLRFGCGMFNTGIFGSNESGIAGFGRGALSLPSQLKVGRFSHCFTTIVDSSPSPVFLGTPDNLEAQATGPIQSTPLVRNPESNHYYLSLKGITVGKTRLPFDARAFALKGDGSGGALIDSGSAVTSVPEAVYRSLVEAFKAQVPLPVNKDDTGLLCFTVSPKMKKETAMAMPKLILHLEGAEWDLPRENYVMYTEEAGVCVVINSAGEGSSRTIIGNFQQQNTHIVYDLDANKLVFVPARCDKL